jgi:DNA-binding PadR family transcriptional regulator
MKGRRGSSKIRKNIASLLLHMGKSYGYEIYKKYVEVFGKVHIRSIYYNLKKGVIEKEFAMEGIRKHKGEYTWGSESERVYYSLGPNADARPLSDSIVKKLM